MTLQIFVKKATIYEHDMTQFACNFSIKIKYEEWKECDMKKKCLVSYDGCYNAYYIK